jgi:hypothetical protein
MGNNPVIYVDPDGEWVHIVVGAVVGGVFNLATNWNSIEGKNIWQKIGSGASYFGVGAAAGAVGAGTGNFAAAGAIIGGGNAALNGGSFTDVVVGAGLGAVAGYAGGVVGGQVSGYLLSQGLQQGFVSGFVSGFAGGATGGFINGFGSGLYYTGDLGEAFAAGGKGALYGGLAGGTAGGIINGINALRNPAGYDADGNRIGRNFWTGREQAPGRGAFAFKNTATSESGFKSAQLHRFSDGSNLKIYQRDITRGGSVDNFEITGQTPQQVWNHMTGGQGGALNPNSVNAYTLSNGTRIVYYPSSSSTGQPTIVQQNAKGAAVLKLRFRWFR